MLRSNAWRSCAKLALAALGLGALAGSASGQQSPADSDFMPTFSIREVMESIVMPSADVIWNAVAVNVTADGVQEIVPETDEDWEKVRWAAVALAEATNLVEIKGRAVAPADTDEEVGEGDLSPEQIEALLKTNWPAWVAHARVLHATALEAVRVIDAHDVDGLTDVGGSIDEACESCHLQFWYPNQ